MGAAMGVAMEPLERGEVVAGLAEGVAAEGGLWGGARPHRGRLHGRLSPLRRLAHRALGRWQMQLGMAFETTERVAAVCVRAGPLAADGCDVSTSPVKSRQ